MTRPSPKDLREMLRYEPETGELFWIERTTDHFKSGKYSKERLCKTWNAAWAGKRALNYRSTNGYCYGRINGKVYAAYRVVWAIFHGRWPRKLIDHINGDPTDNRAFNLREVTTSENARNTKKNAVNTSGHNGVVWSKKYQKWVAQAQLNGRFIYLGGFRDINDAVAAREKFNSENGFTERHGK